MWVKETGLNLCDILRVQNEKEFTLPDTAVQGNNVDILQRLWDIVVERLVNSISEEKNGYAAWFQAAERGSLQTLELIWCRAKEGELNTDELLLAHNEERKTALQFAARENDVGMLQQLWEWAE